jgi:hypothetical protein
MQFPLVEDVAPCCWSKIRVLAFEKPSFSAKRATPAKPKHHRPPRAAPQVLAPLRERILTIGLERKRLRAPSHIFRRAASLAQWGLSSGGFRFDRRGSVRMVWISRNLAVAVLLLESARAFRSPFALRASRSSDPGYRIRLSSIRGGSATALGASPQRESRSLQRVMDESGECTNRTSWISMHSSCFRKTPGKNTHKMHSTIDLDTFRKDRIEFGISLDVIHQYRPISLTKKMPKLSRKKAFGQLGRGQNSQICARRPDPTCSWLWGECTCYWCGRWDEISFAIPYHASHLFEKWEAMNSCVRCQPRPS